jgi:two-component system nitrogen regulation response regulator GlnG
MKQITDKEFIEKETIKSLLKKHIREFYRVCTNIEDNSAIYHSTIIIAEEALIEETLRYTNGVQAKAAKILGINRNTLRKKIEELGIDKDVFE